MAKGCGALPASPSSACEMRWVRLSENFPRTEWFIVVVSELCFLAHLTHSSNLFPVYWDTDSLVVKVSKLIHLEPDFLDIRTLSLELTRFPAVDVLCAFNDESNLSLYPSHMYSSLPDLVQCGPPRRIVVIVLTTLDTTSTGSFQGVRIQSGTSLW